MNKLVVMLMIIIIPFSGLYEVSEITHKEEFKIEFICKKLTKRQMRRKKK